MAARLGNVLYWLGCIVAVGWVAVSHAEEKADDDAFILGCIWTGDSKGTVCGGFATRALCEREGRLAVANGELSKFECISAAELAALLEALGHMFDPPTAAGPGGSDQPTFGQQIAGPSAPILPDWARNPLNPAPPGTYMLPGGIYTGTGVYPNPPVQRTVLPPGLFPAEASPPGRGWYNFMKNGRPSTNIEVYRRTRGKPFIAQ